MTGERERLLADAFHQIAVARETVRVVINDRQRTIVDGSEMRFSDRHANRICYTLTERTGCRFHASMLGVFVLRMPRRLAAELAERLQVIEGQGKSEQIEQRVEQSRSVAGRKDETVAIEPVRIPRIDAQMTRPERVSLGCCSER